MQEQHEKKIQRSKQDIDFLLNDLNSRSTAMLAQKFYEKHSEKIEKLVNYYENIIENLKCKHNCKIYSTDIEKNDINIRIQQELTDYFKDIENKNIDDGIRSRCIKELFGEIKEKEIKSLENIFESYEEMSTLESEQGQDMKSFNSLMLHKKCKSNASINRNCRRFSLNASKLAR